MTAPTPPCSCGHAALGYCPGDLSVCITPGGAFYGTYQLQVDGVPTDWPAGMLAELRFTWGTGNTAVFPGVVDGSWLRWALTPEQTEEVPARANVSLWLDYSGTGTMFMLWRKGGGSCGC